MSAVVIHTDGASRGNPGRSAIAYVIEGLATEPIEYGKVIPDTTNNQAEYQALLAAIITVLEAEPHDQAIDCFADSELMVKQLNGIYRMKDDNLRPHFMAIQSAAEQLRAWGNEITFTAVARSENARADKLANLALDA